MLSFLRNIPGILLMAGVSLLLSTQILAQQKIFDLNGEKRELPQNAIPLPSNSDDVSVTKTLDGRIIVFIPDGTNSPCINRQTDTLLMTVERMVITKKGNLFKKDESAGIITTVELGGRKIASGQQSAAAGVKHNSISVVTLDEYETNNQVSLPVRRNILDNLPLKSAGSEITSVRLKIFMLKKKKKTVWGDSVMALVDFSTKFPLPLDPLSQEAVRNVGELTGRLLSDDKDDLYNVDKRVATADVAFNFSPQGVCNAAHNKTGYYAIVSSSRNKNKPGYVDIGAPDLDKYCFKARSDVSIGSLFVGRKDSAGACRNQSLMSNNYVLFNLTKTTDTVTAGRVTKEQNVGE